METSSKEHRQVTTRIIVEQLVNYIGHSVRLANTPNYKRNLDFQKGMMKAREIKKWINHFKGCCPLRDLCKMIINHQEDLRLILPHMSNNSFTKSEQRLKDLVDNAIYKLNSLNK